jgi:hypothetical protein
MHFHIDFYNNLTPAVPSFHYYVHYIKNKMYSCDRVGGGVNFRKQLQNIREGDFS